MGQQAVLSLVVCALDAPSVLRLLRTVDASLGAEIVVVLQCCSDRDVAEVERFAGCTVFNLTERGLSRARNVGIAATSGTWLAFPDTDATYSPTIDAQLIAHLQTLTAPTDLVWLTWREARRDDLDPQASSWDAARLVVSSELVIRREVVHALGGFDERLGLGAPYGSAEETDLVHRALERGSRLVAADPRFEISHPHGRERTSGLSTLEALRYGYSRGRGYGAFGMKSGRSVLWLFAATGVTTARLTVGRRDRPAVALGRAAGRIVGGLQWRLRED